MFNAISSWVKLPALSVDARFFPLNSALIRYKDAAAINADNGAAHFHVGRVLLLLGKPDLAVHRLKVSLGLMPGNAYARFLLSA